MARSYLLALVIAVLAFAIGCSEDPAQPEEAAEPQEQAVAEVPDSIEVVDDERSLERRIDDAALAAEVRIALVDSKELRRFDFEPEVVNGRVTLRGEVNTQNQRSRAAAIAKDVQGVRSVANELTALEEPAVASQAPDTADTRGQMAQADTAPPSDAQTQTTDASQAADSQDQEPEGEAEPQEEQASYHTVKSGESLWTISRNYGVTIDQIRRLNNLTSNNLRPGQRLQVK